MRIGFLERDERILRDMGVKVSFLNADPQVPQTREVQGVMIAGAAIRSDGSGDFVWLVRDGVVERRSIELGGPRDRPQVLVQSGLVTGDVVVRSAEAPLMPGLAVEIN